MGRRALTCSNIPLVVGFMLNPVVRSGLRLLWWWEVCSLGEVGKRVSVLIAPFQFLSGFELGERLPMLRFSHHVRVPILNFKKGNKLRLELCQAQFQSKFS